MLFVKMHHHEPVRIVLCVTFFRLICMITAGLLGERCIATLRHASQHLASAHCTFIPQDATISLAATSSPALRLRRVDGCNGPHINTLHHVANDAYTCEKLTCNNVTMLSPLTAVPWTIHLAPALESNAHGEPDSHRSTTVVLPIEQTGRLAFIGLVWTMTLWRDGAGNTVDITTNPWHRGCASSWDNALYPIQSAELNVRKGNTVAVMVTQYDDRFDVQVLGQPSLPAGPKLAETILTELEMVRLNDQAYREFMEAEVAAALAAIGAVRPPVDDMSMKHARGGSCLVVLSSGCSYWYQVQASSVTTLVCLPEPHKPAHVVVNAGLEATVSLLTELPELLLALQAVRPTSVVIALDLFDASGLLETVQWSQALAVYRWCCDAAIPVLSLPSNIQLTAKPVQWPDLAREGSVLPRDDGLDLSPLARFEVAFCADVAEDFGQDGFASVLDIPLDDMLKQLLISSWTSAPLPLDISANAFAVHYTLSSRFTDHHYAAPNVCCRSLLLRQPCVDMAVLRIGTYDGVTIGPLVNAQTVQQTS
jgi:hypothetical protein